MHACGFTDMAKVVAKVQPSVEEKRRRSEISKDFCALPGDSAIMVIKNGNEKDHFLALTEQGVG